jgi:hypothetical protein
VKSLRAARAIEHDAALIGSLPELIDPAEPYCEVGGFEGRVIHQKK